MKKRNILHALTIMLSLAFAPMAFSQLHSLARFDVQEGLPAPPSNEGYQAAPQSQIPKKNGKSVSRTKSAAELRNLINGHYYNLSYVTANVASRYWTQVTVDESNNVTISNLMGKGTIVTGTLDVAKSAVIIPVQKLFNEPDYGDFYCVNVDIAAKQYFPERPLEFAIADDGTLSLGNWGAFVLSGEYKGYSTVRYAEIMTPARAEITDYSLTRTPAVNTYPAIYVRENNHRAVITNFYNYGADIVVEIGADGICSIARTQLATGQNASGSTISYYNYSVSSFTSTTNYKLATTATKATFAGDSIVTDKWALSTNTTITNVYDLLEKSVIKVPDNFVSYNNDLNLKGSGTSSDPYLISSPQDLCNLADAVNYSGKYVTSKKCFTGCYFRQTNDIDLSGVPNFEPIGSTTNTTFNGIYDGGGFTISNLKINRRAVQYGGLFGILEKEGGIRNLKIINPVIKSEANYVGVLTGKSSGVIENVDISGAVVASTNYSSGFAGSFAGSLINCSFEGDITGQNYTGGLIGMGWGNISNCHSNARIRTGRTGCIVGGLAGSLAGDTLVLANSTFIGTITDSNGSSTIGGLAGYFQNGKVTGCVSTGHVYSHSVSSNTTVVGGLLGLMAASTIEDCVMSGELICQDAPTFGGLIGKVTKRASGTPDAPLLRNCIVTGVLQPSPSLSGVEFTSADTVAYFTRDNCIYDVTISNCGGEVKYGIPTSELINGSLPTNFNAQAWKSEKGFYPVPEGVALTDAGKVQRASALLNATDVPAAVQGDIILSSGVDWYLLNNGQYAAKGHGLKISNGKASIYADMVASDTIVAVCGDASKEIYLKVLPKEYEGEGTESSPFLIKSANDIFKLQNAVDGNGVRYTGLHFRMANDIDMADAIGFIGFSATGPDNCFNGIFDGAGYKIKNWKADRVGLVNGTATISGASNLMAGFFLYLGPKGVVKNLVMDSTCSIAAGTHTSAIVSQNYGLVENCRNHAEVWGMTNFIGGITDYNAEGATVRNCYNDATIKCGRSIGGAIVAYNLGKVEGCQNDGLMYNSIISSFYTDLSVIGGAGGVVGYNYGCINDCLNNGQVIAPKQMGGIVGQNKDGASITRCLSTGVLSGAYITTQVGAIIGNQQNITDTLSNLYFDRQVVWATAADNKAWDGVEAMTTEELISGKLPAGLDNEFWMCEKGCYPMLKAFTSEPASQFNASTIVNFTSDERTDSRFYMRRKATIAMPSSATAQFKSGKLIVSGSSINFGDNLYAANDTLVFASKQYSKSIPVFASAKVLPNGDGSIANPWQIRSVEEWNDLALFSSAHEMDFEGDNFSITSPLDFSNKSFERLCGGGAVPFQGVLNGNNLTIDNIIVADTTSQANYMGLIRAIGAKGEVKNIVMGAGNNIAVSMNAGAITGTNAGLIQNCVNYATISTVKTYAGGLSGYVNSGGRFINCQNYGTILASSGIAGGIAGGCNAEIGGLISNCENRGKIEASRIAGGLIGSSRVVISNSKNYGDVIVNTEGYSGGITGYHTYDIPIDSCENHGKITSTKGQVGGIVGYLFANGGNISNCVNYGEIFSSASYAGGILGQTYRGNVHINKCSNHGKVTTTTTYAGGIAGSLAAGTSEEDMTILRNVENYGDVEAGTNYAGGIVGATQAYSRFYNLANYGKVYGDIYVGGCFGQLLGQADTCFNSGKVISKRFTVGGIVGTTATTTTITARLCNAFNIGEVLSESATASNRYNIGGILGGGNIKMYNVYNIADLSGYKAVGGLVGAVSKGAYSSIYKETYYGTCIYNGYSVGSVACESGGIPGTIGHIFGTSTDGYTLDYTEFENLHIDGQQKGQSTFVLDSIATCSTPGQITAEVLGEAFVNVESTSCYPILKAYENNEYALLYASALKFTNSSWTRHSLGGDFHIRAPKGVEWSSNDFDVNIQKNTVTWTKLTPGNTYELFATSPVGKRLFKLTPSVGSGIENLLNEKIVAVEYFTLDGVKLQNIPEKGVYLEIVTYSDGRRETEKRVR